MLDELELGECEPARGLAVPPLKSKAKRAFWSFPRKAFWLTWGLARVPLATRSRWSPSLWLRLLLQLHLQRRAHAVAPSAHCAHRCASRLRTTSDFVSEFVVIVIALLLAMLFFCASVTRDFDGSLKGHDSIAVGWVDWWFHMNASCRRIDIQQASGGQRDVRATLRANAWQIRLSILRSTQPLPSAL